MVDAFLKWSKGLGISGNALATPLMDNGVQGGDSHLLRVIDTYGVDSHVQTALLCNSLLWRLKHACPACTYKLEGKEQLVFDMLVTMDGNDSLKCILRRKPGTIDKEGEEEVGESKELKDDREVQGDYYLS
ncbi:hypothetical protein C0991_002282 [Blastosporella zonata]|nr:hypothetical protein C0991_002282 [Blastosporella zonata]